MEGATARVLLVSNVALSGRSTGTQRRLSATARGLARIGSVEYLQWGSRPWRARSERVTVMDPDPPLARHVVVRRRRVPDRLRGVYRLVRAVVPAVHRTERMPFDFSGIAIPSARQVTRAIGPADGYDLVWCYGLGSAIAALAVPASVPMVADVDAVPHLDRDPQADDRVAARERAAWSHWLGVVADRAHVVTFSNPAEASRIALGKGIVLPNGCAIPPFRGARPVGDPAVLVFVGWMGYAANADAARHLATDIVPVLRQQLGRDFVVRLVGSAPADIRRLTADPNVEVVGYVDDLDAAMARADIALVPVRSGAGTRIKVLEALAAQVPVVSTTFGADGLDVEDGEHLLLADDPTGFAGACQQLLTDQLLRERLVAAGYAFVSRHHDWSAIEADIASIATATLRR